MDIDQSHVRAGNTCFHIDSIVSGIVLYLPALHEHQDKGKRRMEGAITVAVVTSAFYTIRTSISHPPPDLFDSFTSPPPTLSSPTLFIVCMLTAIQ